MCERRESLREEELGQNLIPRCCFLFTPAIYPWELTFVSLCGSTPVWRESTMSLSSRRHSRLAAASRSWSHRGSPHLLYPLPFPSPLTPPHLSSCLSVFLVLRHSLMLGSYRPLACTAAAAPCTLARLLVGRTVNCGVRIF